MAAQKKKEQNAAVAELEHYNELVAENELIKRQIAEVAILHPFTSINFI